MKRLLFLILVAFIGCTDSEENAAANFKKANEFFDKKEYEIAEYYYERIPDTSPLYKEAGKKLEVIAAIKRQWVEKKISTEDLSKVVLEKHSFKMDNLGKFPSHFLSVVNHTDILLEYIEVEFTYYDAKNIVITKLTTEIHAKLPKHSSDVYTNVQPGVVNGEIANADAKIIKARFK